MLCCICFMQWLVKMLVVSAICMRDGMHTNKQTSCLDVLMVCLVQQYTAGFAATLYRCISMCYRAHRAVAPKKALLVGCSAYGVVKYVYFTSARCRSE